MKKIVAYGVGGYLNANHHFLPKDMEIIAYADGDKNKTTSISGREYRNKHIISLEELKNVEFDYIYICACGSNELSILDDIIESGGVPLEKIRFLSRIRAYPGWNYHVDESGTIVSDISGIHIREVNKNDRGVLSEIFGNRMYNIDFKKGSVVIDFGMNIGTATLFFAADSNVDRVYGFEPFPDTYDSAMRNIQLSDEWIREKIETYNYAVSDFEDVKEIPVMTEFSGGRTTEIDYLKQVKGKRIEKITFKNAADVLQNIIDSNAGKHIVLKIDTEGSEFEIFNSIRETDIVSRFDAIMLEYHRNPVSIEDYLRDNVYRFIRTGDNEIGMIYAINMDERLE